LIGIDQLKLVVQVISFDHCPTTSTSTGNGASPSKKIKLGITKSSVSAVAKAGNELK
jgi:hypothetical protein